MDATLELLVLQPTPFCNIDCSYCYLPARQVTKQMSIETLDRVFAWVFASGLVREPFTLLWHAGEPMVVSVAFYEKAMELLAKHNREGVLVQHAIQTNATLIDEAWCAFLKKHRIQPGVSVDGPAFLHDRHRKTRQGKGTFERVMRGMTMLREHGVPFYALSVLTAESLLYPDELFDFYQSNGIDYVAFNAEEIEGPNVTSSLLGGEMKERFRAFLTRFVELASRAEPPMGVREFETSVGAIRMASTMEMKRTQENRPWAIVNVDCEGNFSTYSPELLGLQSVRYGAFALGNVASDSVEQVMASERFLRMETDIAQGVKQCREQCSYYRFCGGGAPANKYFENGTFASTETLACRLHKKVSIDVTLAKLEREVCR